MDIPLKRKDKSAGDFGARLMSCGIGPIRLGSLETVQINLGNLCNLRCSHCHVGAGPDGDKIMPRDVMQRIIDFLGNHPGLTVDITGGCPELNPDFRFLIENISLSAETVMVRTNLTAFFEPGLDWVAGWYRDNSVEVIGSLPCYTEENVDRQRGRNVFKASIQAIKLLNELGYGREKNLQLNLVYNPGEGFLPGRQEQLEADYKRELHDRFGICFNRLFTITNAPIGRFRDHLLGKGIFDSYLALLANSFNSDAVDYVMCRRLVSVDYRGLLYNCDFNQTLDLPIELSEGQPATIERLDDVLSRSMEAVTGTHCYCCTAGAGSSCTGSLTG
jgi:radical SAM/Cys-rich protein